VLYIVEFEKKRAFRWVQNLKKRTQPEKNMDDFFYNLVVQTCIKTHQKSPDKKTQTVFIVLSLQGNEGERFLWLFVFVFRKTPTKMNTNISAQSPFYIWCCSLARISWKSYVAVLGNCLNFLVSWIFVRFDPGRD
jgi:hypothetical protein